VTKKLDLPIVYRNSDKETCFNYSYKSKNNLKEIFNAWDIFIDESMNSGNSHFAITINIPDSFRDKEDYKDLLKNKPIYFSERDKKDYNYFEDLSHGLFTDWMEPCVRWYVKDIWDFTKLSSWYFITTEENEEGYLHLHGILAIKNIIDYNKNIPYNILNHLKKCESYTDLDMLIKPLNKFKDIKGWLRYLHVNKIMVFQPMFWAPWRYQKHLENVFSSVYEKQYRINNTQKEISDQHLDLDFSLCLDKDEDVLSLSIQGIKLDKNKIDEQTFIDIISYFLILNNYYICNDKVYFKIENTFISYKEMGTIKEVLYDKFQENVVAFFINNFPCQFIGFNFYSLIKYYKGKMEKSILKVGNLSNFQIKLDFTIFEFADGIYDMKTNRFYKSKFFKNKNLNSLCTIKFYNKSYNWTRNEKPKEWLKGIVNALDGNNKDFKIICIFIAQLFQPNRREIKRNFLYAYGGTNTGKTTYLTNFIKGFFGDENVGTIIGKNSNFRYQDILNKDVVLIDEFKYDSSSSSEFLKILGGETLLTSEKYSPNHITIGAIKGFITSNVLIHEKNEGINKALNERIHIIKFLNEVIKDNKYINESLKEEEAQIMIFCNKLLFSLLGKKTNKRLKISNTIDNFKL